MITKTKVKINYMPAKGAPLTQEQADRYGPVIAKLIEIHGKNLKNTDIVAEAELVSSPIHDWFEWDNDKAAVKFRLIQAGQLQRYIWTSTTTKEGTICSRAFIPVTNVDTGRRYYTTLGTVMLDQPMVEETVSNALEELLGWYTRFSKYRAIFSGIFEAIENMDIPDKLKIKYQFRNKKIINKGDN